MELDAIGKAITEYHLVPLVSHSNMGLEVTMQRVDGSGKLSTQPMPDVLAKTRQNHQIHNEFAQTQLKLVTPATADVDALMAY